jgi:recombination protein RecT
MAEKAISRTDGKSITVELLRDSLHSITDKIEDALPGQLKGQAKRFIQVSLLAFATSKSRDTLEKCKLATYLQAFLEACSAGFPLDNKAAYAIPYGREVTCSFDYKALITAARRCGAIKDAWAQDVCERDSFEWRDENGRKLYSFKMAEDEDNRGEIKGAFAVAILPNDLVRFEYMTKKQLEKLQASSKSPQSPAWKNWRERMVCKGPMKRILQGLETDSSFGFMLDVDNREFDLDKIVDGRASETRVKTYDELADALHEAAQPQRAIEHQPEAETFIPAEEEREPVTVPAAKPQRPAAVAGIPPRPTRPSIGNHPTGIR